MVRFLSSVGAVAATTVSACARAVRGVLDLQGCLDGGMVLTDLHMNENKRIYVLLDNNKEPVFLSLFVPIPSCDWLILTASRALVKRIWHK